jgi:Fe-S-cluster containining protein
MSDGFDFNSFSMEIERTATALMGDAPSDDEFIQACRVVQEMAETALVRFRGDATRIACGPGCAHCCVVNVAVLQPEATTIVAYLERKLAAGEFLALQQKVDALYAAIRWLDEEERIRWKQPCALLDEAGNCSVYPVRPLLCRGMTSIDPETCRQAIDLLPLEDAPPVTVNLFQSFLFNQAFIALARAMENAGHDSRILEMTAAIKTLLDERHG